MASIMCPTPVRQLWLYRPTGPGVWEVGFFDTAGDWCPESIRVEPGPADKWRNQALRQARTRRVRGRRIPWGQR